MHADPHLATLIDLALAEDLGSGDVTTAALYPPGARGRARLVAREPLVVAGLDMATNVFTRLDPRCRLRPAVRDGARAKKGTVLARLQGPLRAMLEGERTALNFLRHLSGIATQTRRFADVLGDTGCVLLDTRKTTPGLRVLEKAAVRAGGGHNHRMGLFDGVLLKDNHIAAAGSIAKAVRRVRARIPPTLRIEVECTTLEQVRAALRAGVDIIMLDNMSPRRMARAVELIGDRARTEASGRLDLETVRPAADAGVDMVSVGALTHSATSVDIAMDMDPA